MVENIIGILISVILFLAASYFVFYKSWLKSLGKEVAKLSTKEELITIEESVKKEFNESLESYKSKLEKELYKSNITYQIQFAFLHKERAKAILELYRKLVELHSAMLEWTAPFKPNVDNIEEIKQKQLEMVARLLQEFQSFFTNNRLLFEENICKHIDDLMEEFFDKSISFAYGRNRIESGRLQPRTFEDYVNQLSQISEEIRNEFPTKIKEVETQFRKLLSVEGNNSDSQTQNKEVSSDESI